MFSLFCIDSIKFTINTKQSNVAAIGHLISLCIDCGVGLSGMIMRMAWSCYLHTHVCDLFIDIGHLDIKIFVILKGLA
jgi:hypothetical protein